MDWCVDGFDLKHTDLVLEITNPKNHKKSKSRAEMLVKDLRERQRTTERMRERERAGVRSGFSEREGQKEENILTDLSYLAQKIIRERE